MLTDHAIDRLPAWTLVQVLHGVARRFGAAFAEVDRGCTQFDVLVLLAARPGLDMSGNAVRLQAIKGVEASVPPAVGSIGAEMPREVFGANVCSARR